MQDNADVTSGEDEHGVPRVVAGIGLVAAKDLDKGGFLVDASAGYHKGAPPDFGEKDWENGDGDCYRTLLIKGGNGYFQLHTFSGGPPAKKRASTTFYMNEARNKQSCNVK
jgi:hypothetical protein